MKFHEEKMKLSAISENADLKDNNNNALMSQFLNTKIKPRDPAEMDEKDESKDNILIPQHIIKVSSTTLSLTSLSHFPKDVKLGLSVISYVNMTQFALFKYDGINDLNRSCPAVSHIINRIVLSSKKTFFVRKSIPTVGAYASSAVSYL